MFASTPGGAGLFAFEDERGRYGFKDGEGRVRIAPRFLHAYEFFAEGITGAVEPPATFVFIDTNGRAVARAYPEDNGPDYFVEGLARIVANGNVGFIDRSGKIVVRPQYPFASSFCNGMAVVCSRCWRGRSGYTGGKWGYLDTTGAVAIPLIYDGASSFSEGGHADAVLRGQRVRIDRTGRQVDPSAPMR
jgi:hypothetical protein